MAIPLTDDRVAQKSDRLHAIRIGMLAAILGWMIGIDSSSLQAVPITVPNGSFESPNTTYATALVAAWQQTSRPSGYTSTEWAQKTGVFKNQAASDPSYIDNCDRLQAVWLFADREVGLFQDYNSIGRTSTSPTHEFDEEFQLGISYRLTVGVIGGGGGMKPGVTFQIGLYYLDAQGNHLIVATTDITNNLAVFSNTTHFVDFEVNVPPVQTDDPWAGRKMGIHLLSTVTSGLVGGYWDVDNVRLEKFSPPQLTDPVWNGDAFQFTLMSDPGLKFEVLASTDITAPLQEWDPINLVTNVSGTLLVSDSTEKPTNRYYVVREILD